VSYDYLVVCPGLQLDWDKIAGLKETIGKNNVCTACKCNLAYAIRAGNAQGLKTIKYYAG
jgi:NADPH-dependent 2,4-dienoyl-CoA reductase/sulfur reductase-like enzyme